MEKKKDFIRLPIRFELAYEIIYYSILVILFGITFLFASNLLRFNWYSVLFGILALLLIFFKRSSYLLIDEGKARLVYFKFIQAETLYIQQIQECHFHERSPLVKIIMKKKNENTDIYLKQKNKEKLLNWLVTHYPDTSAIHIHANEKNS